MEIPAAIQSLTNGAYLDPPSLLKYMKPGQLLHAKVASVTVENLVKLLVGNTELLAKTRIPLIQGEQLLLRVEKGLPEPELKILQTELKQTANEVLRSAMSRQLPPKEVQQLLRQIVTPETQRLPTTQQIVKVLLPRAPLIQDLNSNTIRQALQHSGLFFETNLAHGSVSPQDQKLQLLQLLRLFTPQARTTQQNRPAAQQTDSKAEGRQSAGVDQLMNRLLRLVEGSLSRIQSHQAASLTREEPGSQLWQFDLPLQIANKLEHLHLRIQQEDGNDDVSTGEKVWKVEIAFDFEELGEVNSRIHLNRDDLSAAFWCQRESTTELIEKNIPLLESALKEAGLQVKAISSLTGIPPQPGQITETFLDEHV